MPAVTTPRISKELIGATLDLPIKDFKAYGDYSRDNGYGLGVEVWTGRDAREFTPDLELELEGAAKACAALAL